MPLNFPQSDRLSILNNLQNGRRNAIGAKRLARLIGFSISSNQIRLRTLIKECIEVDGDLIGASTGRPAGFFLISSLAELNTYLDSLEDRLRTNNMRRNALINSWNITNSVTTKISLNIT